MQAELLTGMPVQDASQAEKAIDKLFEKGCQCVILTLGEKGSVFASVENKRPVHVPAEKVKAVDTTVIMIQKNCNSIQQ